MATQIQVATFCLAQKIYEPKQSFSLSFARSHPPYCNDVTVFLCEMANLLETRRAWFGSHLEMDSSENDG